MNQKVLLLAIGGIIILGTLLSFQTKEMIPQVQNLDFRIGCQKRGGINCIAGAANSATYGWILNDRTLSKTNPTTDLICSWKGLGRSIDSLTLPHNTYTEYYYAIDQYPGWRQSTEGNQVYTCYNSVTCQYGKVSC